MLTATVPYCVELDLSIDAASIRRAVERIRGGLGLAGFSRATQRPSPGVERRCNARQPLVISAFLMPATLDGGRVRPAEPVIQVITLNMSPRGVGIQHEQPLPGGTCLLVFDLWAEGSVTLVVEPRWTNKDDEIAHGHRSGFAIIGVASERHAA